MTRMSPLTDPRDFSTRLYPWQITAIGLEAERQNTTQARLMRDIMTKALVAWGYTGPDNVCFVERRTK